MRGPRIALAQVNTTVGDLVGNGKLVQRGITQALDLGADLVAFPEMTITGYPPEDLVLSRQFIVDNKARLEQLASSAREIVAVVGFVDIVGDRIYNAAAVLAGGQVAGVYHKIHLPNYGVFDEVRYFARGHECPLFRLRGMNVGVNVCEDIWLPLGPSEVQCAAGADIIININASPYEMGKQGTRVKLVTGMARRNRAYGFYVNQVGGQDELVFDGGSMMAGPDGELVGTAPRFEETVIAFDVDPARLVAARQATPPERPTDEELASIGEATHMEVVETPERPKPRLSAPAVRSLERVDAVYRALVLATRDYVHKTGFEKVAVGLSGGIDSSLVACIAVDALGAENVTGVSLPSRYSSEGSITDAYELAKRLGIEVWRIPIEQAHIAFEDMLAGTFEGTEPNTAEENVQSRIRGNVMMTIANKFGWLVLTTGNKSEMATGYATLYGDMAGGFAVIKDVPKTLVYQLSRHRNERGPGSPIPQAAIDKPPSAELRPGQVDQDSLPPYEMLDRILTGYIEKRLSSKEILDAEREFGANGGDEATVRRVLRMVDINEYKRRQAPPGVKITSLAFGRDRRLPIASRYRP